MTVIPRALRARLRCDTMRAHARGEARVGRLLDHALPRAPRFARLRLVLAELRARLGSGG